MICEACHGTGNVLTRFDPYDGVWVDFPCQTCGGTGRDYCCGGSERYGQLDGESTGRDPGAASKTDGAETHSDQDGGSPPEYMTEAELLQGLQDLGLGVFTD